MNVCVLLLAILLVVHTPACAMPSQFGNSRMPMQMPMEAGQPALAADLFLPSAVSRASCSLDDNYNAWCRVAGSQGYTEGWLCDKPCIPYCSQSRCPGGTVCNSMAKHAQVCPTGGPNKCTLDDNYDAFCRAKSTDGKYGAWQCDKPCIPYCKASTCPDGMECNSYVKHAKVCG